MNKQVLQLCREAEERGKAAAAAGKKWAATFCGRMLQFTYIRIKVCVCVVSDKKIIIISPHGDVTREENVEMNGLHVEADLCSTKRKIRFTKTYSRTT